MTITTSVVEFLFDLPTEFSGSNQTPIHLSVGTSLADYQPLLDEWDPSVLDHDPPHLDGLDPSQVSDQPFGDPMFDAYGDFNERIIANLNILLDAPPGDCGSYTAISSFSTINLHQSSPQEPDWNALRPFFAWTSPSSIKDTFNVTTRHGTAPHTQNYIKKHFKYRNPVFNIPRHSEAVATDTIFSDTPAVDDGSTMAQFFLWP